MVGDINAAAAADNILLPNGTTALAADKTINSVSTSQGTLNLGGHRLVVDSGGIYRGVFSNGQVTAGFAGGHELIVYDSTVSASIVDDGSNPVSVTTVGNTAFSGENTYSGTTYVNEQYLYLLNEKALPENTDLQIVGGEVRISYTGTTARHLHNVRIAGEGALTNLFTGLRGQGIFSFDQVVLEDGVLQPGKIVGGGQIFKRSPGAAAVTGDTGSTYNGEVVVEEGLLAVGGLPTATFRVEGGTLILPTGANSITLSGGALEYTYLTGNITVNEASRIIPDPQGNSRDYGLAGSFSGAGDLLFQNRPVPPDDSNINNWSAAATPVAVRGHSPSFTGNIDIDSSTVSIAFEDSLGTGSVTIHADGKLFLAPAQNNFNGAKLDFANRVYLAGGELSGVDSVFRPQRLLGDLFVSGNSWISALEVPGAVHLADGSSLTTTSYFNTSLLGDVLVSGTATFNVGRSQVRSSGLLANRAVVRLGGRIVSDSPMSILQIENAGLDDLVLAPSFYVQAGQSLGIKYQGEFIPLNVAGGTLSGSGHLLNPIIVGPGGHLSPGQSPGTLTFENSLTIGSASVYDWEINNATGTAGASSGWDLLRILDQLLLTSTPDQPYIVRVSGLDSLPLSNFAIPDLTQPQRWLIASATSIVGFDSHAVAFEVVSSPNRLRTVLPQFLSLESDGRNLFLVYQVPEPGSIVLLAAVQFFMPLWRRRRI
jgi:fibronectin-binding autotransporter adhesin